MGNVGIPMVLFRLFPEIFPEIWGPPSEQMIRVGFGPDPFEPTRTLPLGIGYTASDTVIPVPVPTPLGTTTVPVAINVTAMTCIGCHGGTAIGPDGQVRKIVGAPNTLFDQFRGAVYLTVNDPRFTADNFRAAIASKPAGFFYGDPLQAVHEQLERGIFSTPGVAEQFLGGLKQNVNAGAARFAQTMGAYTYALPNAPNLSAPSPGFLDAIGAGIALIADPAILNTPDLMRAALPPAPAMIDIMSVWSQKDRPAAQWDGSIPNAVHRNLAAEFGVIGDPKHLNMQNVDLTTPFTQQLPPAPYPFDVDVTSAGRGKALFIQNCASCHHAGNAQIFPASYTGTDPNRANIWSDFTVTTLRQVLRVACTDPVTCNNPDGTPLSDDQILHKTGGYMALPLDGIWARAPYLHNGSVPTLAALLTKQRPKTFFRGNPAYDPVNVGFVTSSGSGLYDTTLSGNSNAGHDTADFLGNVDWQNQPKLLHDLLEYLKTL
jgi:mono/diheme cytochrome c family protein